MQSVPVKSTPIYYLVEIKRTTLAQGAAVLEENSQPVAVLLPVDEYRAYRQWQAERQTLQTTTPPDFASEVKAFEQMRPALQKRYSGQAVAIHDGRVVAAGNDKMSVYHRCQLRLM